MFASDDYPAHSCVQLMMSRAFVISVLVFSLIAVVNATEPESVFEPISLPSIPSRMKLADTVEIPYWLYVVFIIIAVCQVCSCCCICCTGLLGGASAASAGSALSHFGAASRAKKILQSMV